MKVFIALLLILLSFSDGKNLDLATSDFLPVGITQTYPSNADITVNVTWAFNRGNNITNVGITVKNLQSAQWAAIGFGQNQTMSEAHVFICKRLPNDTVVINRYINPEYHHQPVPAGSDQGGLFMPGVQLYQDGVVTCLFNLSHFNNTEQFKQLKELRPLSQSGSYYPLLAVGPLDINNDVREHAENSRTAQPNTVNLNQNQILLFNVTYPDDGDTSKLKRVPGI